MAAIATLQRFTADNQYSEAMGPILYRNHYTAFIEVVLPLALYGSLRRKRDAPVYAVMAAAMYASVIVSASRSGLILTSTELRVVPAILWLRGWGPALHSRTGYTIPLVPAAGGGCGLGLRSGIRFPARYRGLPVFASSFGSLDRSDDRTAGYAPGAGTGLEDRARQG